MSQGYMPPELLSFDPAIFLHSQPDEGPTESFSDDVIALQGQIEESTARKSREGIVIQHRAWQTNDVFRSEEDHPIRETAMNVQHTHHLLMATRYSYEKSVLEVEL
jgi:chromosome transmission fidelity protein 18